MPTHRLAAILFADIVGYTAMMQADEAAGIAKASKLRAAVETLVPQHGGELIEMRGDGALCVFGSSTEAVRCAMGIQAAVNEEVPLRIGLHQGDIVQRDGHLFGDAVNIASRIESMGVAGAILISSSIRQQIKNKPEFELVSLGKVAFKNVAEPMEVYSLGNEGLVVPDQGQMLGKGQKVEEAEPPSWNGIRLAIAGFLAMAVGAGLFWALGSQWTAETALLDEDIREAKVAVAIQNNLTGEERLDALGFLASEWLTSSLREIGVRTVSSDMVRQYSDYVNVLPNDPEDRPAFSDITGARYVLKGSYYLSGQDKDSLRFHLRLNSAQTGEQVQAFPVIYGPKQDEEGLVEEIRQRLLGYWAMKGDFQLPSVSPPKYEAYQAFIQCYPSEFPCYLEAVNLDSTFVLARCLLLQASALFDQDSTYRANESYIQRNWETCTAYEKNLYRFITATHQHNYPRAFEAIYANFQMDSTDILAIHESGVQAWWMINRPDICVAQYEIIFDQLDLYQENLYGFTVLHYTAALNRLGRHQEVLDLVERMGFTDWMEKAAFNRGCVQPLIAYIALGRIEEAIRYWEDVFQYLGLEAPRIFFYTWAAKVYATSFPSDTSNPFITDLWASIDQLRPAKNFNYWSPQPWLFPQSHPANVYYLLQNWQEAEEVLLEMRAYPWADVFSRNESRVVEGEPASTIYPHYARLGVEEFLGRIYARQGRREEALKQLEKLDMMIEKKPPTRNIFLFGLGPYLKARIYARLGEKAAAVDQLQEALEAGHLYNERLTFDLDLASLRGYAPYEELIRIKM